MDYTGLLVAKDIRPRYDVIRGTEALIIGRPRANNIEFRSYAIYTPTIHTYMQVARNKNPKKRGKSKGITNNDHSRKQVVLTMNGLILGSDRCGEW